jgi:hypothetical protein
LRIEWSYLIFNDQTGRRDSQLLVSSTDANGSYLAPNGGEVLSQDAPQAPLSWLILPRDLTFNVSIPAGSNYYLRWSFADLAGGSGSGVNRDEVGIAGLRVTGIVVVGDYNRNGVVDAADYAVWRKTDGTAAGYNAWRTNFGQPGGSGLGVGASAAVPEPASALMLLMGVLAICSHDARLRHKLNYA